MLGCRAACEGAGAILSWSDLGVFREQIEQLLKAQDTNIPSISPPSPRWLHNNKYLFI